MLKQKIKTGSEFSFAKRNFSGHITRGDFKTAAIFLFFEIETCFLVCNPIFGSSMGVQKELGKNLFFPRVE